MSKIHTIDYRKDIDGLRAIAVLSVIVFHMGYLPNGYLGVDIFFAISGFLITKIVYKEAVESRFSIANFYLRRTRRIIPLVSFICVLVLAIGYFVMLPDDFENMCQSIVATNLFANNVLQLITTGNYWDVVNEYKPLMHTWSLGVEEQFYLIYPIIFIFLGGKKSKYILPILITLTLISFALLFISKANYAHKFYSIQYRFFELSLGGIAAILFKDKILPNILPLLLVTIILILLLFDLHLPANFQLILSVIASVALLVSGGNSNKIFTLLMENKVMIWIGKISFSLYMWHQVVLAFTRYLFTDNISFAVGLLLFVVMVVLSFGSYFIVEQPFRDKTKIKTSTLLSIVTITFVLTTSTSYYFYSLGGIVRDVPELELYKSIVLQNNVKVKIHSTYNDRIYKMDKNFTTNDKIQVLVVGNSFARDFANVLLESSIGNRVEISYLRIKHHRNVDGYTNDMKAYKDLDTRLKTAKFIFFSELNKENFITLAKTFNIDSSKVWNVGTKNFGSNNGIYYNQPHDEYYCKQRVKMNDGFVEKNNLQKQQWGARYIDYLTPIVDNEGKVPVFTNDCKFISQDCRHFTHAGAVQFAKMLDPQISQIILSK